MSMRRAQTYRRRSDAVQAIQVTPANVRDVAKWCGGRVIEEVSDQEKTYAIVVPTFEGKMRANPGDWIMQNTLGEFMQYNKAAFDDDYVRA